MSAALVAILLTWVAPVPVAGQGITRVTEAEARAWAAQAASIADGNVRKFNAEFEKRAEKRIRVYQPKGYKLSLGLSPSGLSAVLYGQVAAFQFSASEQVRQFRPLEGATWRPGVSLLITTRLLTSPVIERAVLRRGAEVIEPTLNLLQTMDSKNLEGAVFKTREGSVLFPVIAFEPRKGADARMIIIPVAGKNFEVKLRDIALAGAFERPKSN